MKKYTLLVMLVVASSAVFAQGPANTGTYYQAADGKKGAELKTALFSIISPHEIQSYTPGVWDAINSYDIRPDGKIWDIYSNISNFVPVVDQDKGGEASEGEKYNREHSMPKSWFNESKDDTMYPMYTDLHHLFPTDHHVNEMRSNYPYGEVAKITSQSEGGFSKFGICDESIGYVEINLKPRVFEPADEYKGDLARAYFYMATAYESYKNGEGKERSPKNWSSPMLSSDVYPFFTEWALKMLLRWAEQDPVSDKEVNRNEAIYGIQKNRNPYVDYPGLEQYVWGSNIDVAFSYDNYEPAVTGISDIRRQNPNSDHHIYNLNGQRVDGKNLQKGIYISRGRKIIIR